MMTVSADSQHVIADIQHVSADCQHASDDDQYVSADGQHALPTSGGVLAGLGAPRIPQQPWNSVFHGNLGR